MIRSLSSLPLRRALMLSLLAGLAACQTEVPKPPPVASGSCPTERAEFIAATDRGSLPADQPGGADGYYANLQKGPASPAQGLTTDLAGTANAVDRVTASFASLKACRLDRAEEIRTGVAGGSVAVTQMTSLLASERGSFEGEIAIARRAAQTLDQRAQLLRQAADKLAATAPGTDLKVAKAAAAPPRPPQYFTATAATSIYAKPASAAPRIAELRRLQRVQGPGGEVVPGWVQLTLNDGSAGYVESGVLKAAQTNASAQKAAARAEALREADGDPVAAAVLAARVGLPDREQALAGLIETSDEQTALAFNPALPPTDTPDSPSVATAQP